MNSYKCLFIAFAISILSSCDAPVNTFKPKNEFEKYIAPTPPDYSKPEHWAALPTKKDNADRTPSDSLKDGQAEAQADVFFVYPTIYIGSKKYQNQWNAEVNNASFNADVEESTILHQASVFNAAGKFIPLDTVKHTFTLIPQKDTASSRKAFELAYSDVKRAFEYYLENYNDGRPIIIASHSQGTNHCEQLLKDFFDKKPLQKQLIIAYLVGMPIYRGTFQNIFPCRNAEETSCFCSWNTYSANYYPPNYHKKLYRAVATNPINWTTDGTPADYSENKGGVMSDYTLKNNPSNAKSNRGLLWIDKLNLNVPAPFFNKKNWHVADYNLFWMNIRENSLFRTQQFIDNQ